MKTKELKITSLIFYFLAVALALTALFMLLGACSRIDLATISKYLGYVLQDKYPMKQSVLLEALNLNETLGLLVPSIWLFVGAIASRVSSKVFEVIYDNVERNSR